MFKKFLCAAVILAVCAVTAFSLGSCGRDLGDLTDPPPTTARQANAQETVIITIDAYEFSALLSSLGGQIQFTTVPETAASAPVPATVAP